MKLPRYLRLLPSVVVIGGALFVVKTSGLVHEAYAQASEKVAALGGGLTHDPVPANADYAGGEDDQIASANEVDVINAMARRRKELDAREAVLNTQANVIAAAEQRVDAKIAQLKALQTQIATLLGQRDQQQDDQIKALVKTYTSLGKKAGPIFAGLPDEVAVPVAQQLKPDVLATIMQGMSPDAAQKLTVKLANKLTLPQTAEAPAAAAAAGPQAAATPPAKPTDKPAEPKG